MELSLYLNSKNRHPGMGADFRIYEYLLDFLFQSIEFRRAEEFSERDTQTIAYHFDREQLGILSIYPNLRMPRSYRNAYIWELIQRKPDIIHSQCEVLASFLKNT